MIFGQKAKLPVGTPSDRCCLRGMGRQGAGPGGSGTTRASPRGTLRALLPLVWSLVAAVLLCPVATRADVALLSFDDPDLPLRFVGAAEHYLRVNDECGVCGGDSKTCMGCDGVPNSLFRYDGCGVCGDPSGDTFNKKCVDCEGTLHGGKIVDDCGVCADPADETFSRAGVPDSHLGGCVGCDGIPNSGNRLDACGVCAGLGCTPDDPTKRSWCCDCFETAFGTHVVDFCCECVDRKTHWLGLSNGAREAPPSGHLQAEVAWKKGRDIVVEQIELTNRFKEENRERKQAGVLDGSIEPSDVTFPRSFEIYALGVEARTAFEEGWDLMTDPALSDDLSQCYAEVYILNNRTNPRDACGVCGGNNETCVGCSGSVAIPDGGPVHDDCAGCGTNNNGIDQCDVCLGDNQTCVGCDGVPGSGKVFDGCLGSTDPRYLNFLGRTGEPGSGCSDPDEFKLACDAGEGGCCGCDGVPNSGATKDGCGECHVWSDAASDKVVNYTCSGCDGVPFSIVRYDWCCACDGEGDFVNSCYHDATVFGAFGATPFDPYTDVYDNYFNDVGKERYDRCGECAGQLKNGETCLGCDGVYGSGVTYDGCGVCGGDCSTCNASQTGLPYDCELPGKGWTGIDRTCSFHRLEGPNGPNDQWTNWVALPNGTSPDDGLSKVPRNQTWYTRLNRADAKPFLDVAKGECRMYLEPPPPPTARERREWVVQLYGREEGPFTLVDLESGYVLVTESTTRTTISVPLLPATLVGRVTTMAQTQTVVYGTTSRYQSRVDGWRERMGDRFATSATGTEQPNVVTVDGFGTKLTNWDLSGGAYQETLGIYYGDGSSSTGQTVTATSVAFLPMSTMPGMERVAYPYCTGSTWRGGKHRLHGKKLPGNFLGIITTENITDAGDGLTDQDWNPLDEYIYDVSNGWMDQQCTCSWEWEYQSEPIAPTCPRYVFLVLFTSVWTV